MGKTTDFSTYTTLAVDTERRELLSRHSWLQSLDRVPQRTSEPLAYVLACPSPPSITVINKRLRTDVESRAWNTEHVTQEYTVYRLCRMEELVRSQKYNELAEYCEEEELKVRITFYRSVTRMNPGDVEIFVWWASIRIMPSRRLFFRHLSASPMERYTEHY